MIFDRYGRHIHYLRISLTDRCNFRCLYCMSEDTRFRPAKELLSSEEILFFSSIFAELGFDKIRLTGGEPTLRPDIVELVQEMSALPGLPEITMTTNASRLSELAAPLACAGLKRCNISLDSLVPEKFERITRRGNLDQVLRGIHAAEEAGLRPIKLNCVVARGFNDDEVVDFARLTIEQPWQVRFIELMPFSDSAGFALQQIFGQDEILHKIEEHFGPLEIMNEGKLDGEARIYRIAGARGDLGFISSVSVPFCDSCSRIRLTADGRIRLCLLSETEVDILGPLRTGTSAEGLKQLIVQAIWNKPLGHGLGQAMIPSGRVMSQIGG
jgi:cyclic pyranopterin phosphate synthase